MHAFSLSRIGLLLQRFFLIHGRSLLGYLGPTFILLFFVWMGTQDEADVNGTISFFNNVFSALLLLLGFYFSSTILKEHRSDDGLQASLTLPASDTEKFASAWLISGPLFLGMYTLAYYLVSLVFIGLSAAFNLASIEGFNALAPEVLNSVKFYLLFVQPVALLGAIIFNRYAGVKTIGVLIGVAFLLAGLALLTFRIVYRNYFDGLFTVSGNIQFDGPPLHLNPDSPFTVLIPIAVILLAATYFKFQEKSV
jgi:hypothetical protein